MFRRFLQNFNTDDISIGSKILTKATAIRWFGWGFAENLIPIFLFSFASGYAEAGLLKSSYELALILTLPIFGMFADRFKATTLIIIGLSMYIVVGTSYLLAGLTGMAIFIVIARVFNGIGFGLDAVGREAYFRRHNTSSKLATVFGYFDSITIFWWIFASFLGIFLIKHFEIHWLLSLIVPTVLIAILIVKKWQKKEEALNKENGVTATIIENKSKYTDLFREFGSWNYQLKIILLLNLILSASWSIIIFFLPINMYNSGASYTTIILFGISASLPMLFGIFLGKIFDKKGPRIFIYGLLIYGFLMVMLSFGESYNIIIATAFLIGVIQEFVSVGKEEIITLYAKPEHYGRVGGFMRSIMNLGAMIGPLIAGILIDSTGSITVIYMGLAFCMFVLAFSFAVHSRITHVRKMKTI
ncbi:MAG: MFS transporter [Candidatus Pacebacteria bacterium]|nr:MFS transporter [Candidatus Paceibacterota bacterium]MCF7862893.1 MFS transporter [Candidatus Paceibacterota bacterium]